MRFSFQYLEHCYQVEESLDLFCVSTSSTRTSRQMLSGHRLCSKCFQVSEVPWDWMDFLGCDSEFTITEGVQLYCGRSLSSDATEIKPWEGVVSKVTFTCETKARLDQWHQGNRWFLKKKNSKTYFDNSHIISSSSILRERGTLECEKTIFIFSFVEYIFTFSNTV